MNVPRVSVLIPSHNRSAELRQALESVAAQSFADFEVIIVDDHSSDEALSVAHEFASRDSRFKVFSLGTTGAPAGRNQAFEKSRSEYVVFLDNDDALSPACLEQRVAFMDARPHLDFGVFRCQLFRDVPGDVPQLWNSDTGQNDLDRILHMDVPWQTASPIWRRESLAQVMPWDTSVLSGQDWEFHIRVLLANLKYERSEIVDCHWRIATADRKSVGVSSFGPEHAIARPQVLRKMLDAVKAAGQLTPSRSESFAALYFDAACALAQRVSNKDGRRLWREAKSLGLVEPKMHRQGWWYILGLRRKHNLEKRRLKHLKSWPRRMRVLRSPFFNRAPLPHHTPRVSVVVSVYNTANYITSALQSIQKQTFRDFEIVVVNDGSRDDTLHMLEDLAAGDCRVRVITRENKGLTASLIESVDNCRGEYLARMDPDDLALPKRFETQVAYLDANPQCVCVGSQIERIDPYGVTIDIPPRPQSHEEIDADLLLGSGWAMVHPVVMMRADAVKAIGNYDAKLDVCEDLDIFLRLAEVGRVANLPEVLLKYRIHLGSTNATKLDKQVAKKKDIIRDAHTRRGLPFPEDWMRMSRKGLSRQEQRLQWGWQALKQGAIDAARNHARDLLREHPFSTSSWRLFACALRGH